MFCPAIKVIIFDGIYYSYHLRLPAEFNSSETCYSSWEYRIAINLIFHSIIIKGLQARLSVTKRYRKTLHAIL